MKTLVDTRVSVCVGQCECHAVSNTQVHHRDFPELHAEGESAAVAADRLEILLRRAYDDAPSDYRRDAIAQALHDVRQFIATRP